MPANILSDIETYQNYAANYPVEYVKTILGINPWKKQADILKAAADPNIPCIAWRSGNGVGKTYLTAAIICQYLDTHYPGLVVVSSASWGQLLKTVWPKLQSIVRNAPTNLGGEMMATEWRRDPQGEWGVFCVSPNVPESFSGFRTANGVLVIIDEASALDYKVHEAIMGLTSARGSKVIYLGNPLHASGPFYDAFTNPDWKQFHTSTMDVLKYDIPGLATKEWTEAREREWGISSPMYKARVLGEFPTSAEDSLITFEMLSKSRQAEKDLPEEIDQESLCLGVDVARFGEDRTVLLLRDKRSVLHIEWFSGQDLMQTCGSVIQLAKEWEVDETRIFIDDAGVGGGLVDRLRELNYAVQAVNNGEAPLDTERFFNTRMETYWLLREAICEGFVISTGTEELDTLAKELVVSKYKLKSNGKLILEEKSEIKKRLKRSPDFADALAMTFMPVGSLVEYL